MVSHTPQHTGRSVKIDALRGIAVLGMVIAHAIFFFQHGSTGAFQPLENILNTTVFTVFVFVFGQSLSRWLDIHAYDHPRHATISILKRTGVLYMVYAVTAIVAVLTSHLPRAQIIPTLVGALSMRTPPNFTEYLPLFILLSASLLLLRPLLRHTRASLLLTFVIGAFSYLIGVTLYPLAVPTFLVGLKALFVGHGTLLRFPVFYYLPVVLWGLWWQHDTDHKTQNKPQTTTHLWIMAATVGLALASVITAKILNVPILNPYNRWPPSIAFLSLGMSLATVGLLLMPAFAWTGNVAKRVLSYYGRDAFDIWVNHLILLFLFRQFVQTRFTDPTIILSLTALLVIASTLLSSLTLTNRIIFPFKVTFDGSTRFRRRYILYAFFALCALILAINQPTITPYGNFMMTPALTVQQKLTPTTNAILMANRTWYARHTSQTENLDFTLKVADGDKAVIISPDTVQILVNNTQQTFSAIAAKDGTIHYTKPVSDFAPGTYGVTASIDNVTSRIVSNTATVYVSEPLQVAWTFDWEGWDAPDSALLSMAQFARQYNIHFTHFVNPRMFLPGVLTQQRSDTLKNFLLGRYTQGDELALHLHMQFDIVEAAGVIPKTANPWGLRTEEGYDIPTTDYSPEEFRQIVTFARDLAQKNGFPSFKGFRAGGWFLSTDQLMELQSLGFVYDGSGRDRPKTGSFSRIPWSLPVGAQPYYPSREDQNIPSSSASGILEIPNNGLNTFEMSVQQLQNRITAIYAGGILTKPTTLVFVSHPQFFSMEFYKIPDVLALVASISLATNQGPAVFTTMSDIRSLWSTSTK